MRRRSLLSSLGLLVATTLNGCLDEIPLRNVANRDQAEAHFEVDPDEVPAEHPLRHSIEVRQSDIRFSDDPFTVNVSIENVTEDELEYGDRRDALFESTHDRGFVLANKANERYEFDEEADVWRATGPMV